MEALKSPEDNETENTLRGKNGQLSKDLIEEINTEILKANVLSVTLDFEDDNFVYFKRFDKEVKSIHGSKDEYLQLQCLLKANDAPSKDGFLKKPAILQKEKKTDEESAIICQSLFTPLSTFMEAFSKAELYFEPFKAPGGDFYWCKNYPYKTLAIVGDCTGHGTHGAMIAMSIMTLIKQHFRLLPNLLEKEILNIYEIISSLKESEDSGFLDCELGMILLDRRTNALEYAGSGVNMIMRRADDVEAFSTRKYRLLSGKQDIVKLQLEKDDEIYLFSDGIADQFNAKNTKKLGSKGVRELIKTLPKPPSSSDFKGKLDAFRGDTKSMDDQTLLMLTV